MTGTYKQALRIRLLAMDMTDQSNMMYGGDSTAKRKVKNSLVDSVEHILSEYGYPSVSNVGRDAAIVPALILVHADLTTQLKYKNLLHAEALKGNIPGGWGGTLLDKIQVAQKGTQLYGSQYKVLQDENGYKFIFYPIEDSLNLESRRKRMGFTTSYKDYKNMVENQYKR